jgi:hypothetical protein
MSCAMNSRWSTKDKPLPFSPKDFLPKTKEQIKLEQAAQAKLRIAHQKMIATHLDQMVKACNAQKRVP